MIKSTPLGKRPKGKVTILKKMERERQMIVKKKKIVAAGLVGMVLAACLLVSVGYAESETRLSSGQTVYVPIYSHVYAGDMETPFYLAATLSIRNTDPNHPITIVSVNYYDSNGRLLRSFLDKPSQLNALASTRFIIKESDKAGGSGANFIVSWEAEAYANIPIIESVMIGTKGQQGISFLSRGQAIKKGSK